MVEEPISTFNLEALNNYMLAYLPKPRWRAGFKEIPGKLGETEFALGPVKIGAIKEIYRTLTMGGRIYFAVWTWLEPTEPARGLQDLPAIRTAAGLDHVDHAAFLKSLLDETEALKRRHPKLRLWIERRQTLIEFQLSPPRVDAEFSSAAMSMRMELLAAVSTLYTNRMKAQKLAVEVSERAMNGAAMAAFQALGAKDCRLSANLMVRAVGDAAFTPNELASDNWARAQDLWNEQPSPKSQRLVVVAESEGSRHLGFWIPLDRGNDDPADMPGAPTAYHRMCGASVFKDDLPPLHGFPKSLVTRWSAYMTNDFKERMFVSLPLVAPRPGATLQEKLVVAVLNVNADFVDQTAPRRAYHKEWLATAISSAAQFVELAFWALQVQMAATPSYDKDQDDRRPMLDTGDTSWNTLPAFPTLPPLLPGGQNSYE